LKGKNISLPRPSKLFTPTVCLDSSDANLVVLHVAVRSAVFLVQLQKCGNISKECQKLTRNRRTKWQNKYSNSTSGKKQLQKLGDRGKISFWVSENYNRPVHFESHSPIWRVLSKFSLQHWWSLFFRLGLIIKFSRNKNTVVSVSTGNWPIENCCLLVSTCQALLKYIRFINKNLFKKCKFGKMSKFYKFFIPFHYHCRLTIMWNSTEALIRNKANIMYEQKVNCLLLKCLFIMCLCIVLGSSYSI